MIKVNRSDFLQSLQAVQPGVSTKDITLQSSCLVFKEGEVVTFNGEIACRMKTPLTEVNFTGAIAASPLLKVLDKMDEEFVEIELKESEFVIHGQNRDVGITLEKEISLPIDSVDKPGKTWAPLHENFLDAISTVQECAGSDKSKFALTCVHIHPKWIEAFDNTQLSRYKLNTGVEQPCLVRHEYIKCIVNLDMLEFNETQTWIHFRNAIGLVVSCRRYIENYPNLSPILKVTGEKTQLPPGLAEAAERAEIFSSQNADGNRVRIDLRPGKLRVKGVGNSGWYTEVKTIKYDGPYLCFQITPKLLIQLVKRYSECEVTDSMLKVNGGKFVYVASLVVPGVATSPPKKGK